LSVYLCRVVGVSTKNRVVGSKRDCPEIIASATLARFMISVTEIYLLDMRMHS
jgi:hypothetical protein